MVKSFVAVAAAMLALTSAHAAAIDAGITGSVTTSQLNPVPGSQTITINGSFTSYSATSDLPQITGGDLSAYTFSMTGLAEAYDAATRTTTYDVTGTINGYGQIVQYLSSTLLTVTFNSDFTGGTLLGTLESAGAITPDGFPGPVDFTAADGSVIAGTFQVTDAQGDGTIEGTISGVPEPTSWAMFIGGFGLVGAAMRRKKAAVSFA